MRGEYGFEKKSDCLIIADLSNKGIDINIESKVKKLFGSHIEKAVHRILTDMGIKNVKISVKDFGALDFVIKARTRTAVNQALNGSD